MRKKLVQKNNYSSQNKIQSTLYKGRLHSPSLRKAKICLKDTSITSNSKKQNTETLSEKEETHFQLIRQQYMMDRLSKKLGINYHTSQFTIKQQPQKKIKIEQLDSTVCINEAGDQLQCYELAQSWDRLGFLLGTIVSLKKEQKQVIESQLNKICQLIKKSFVSLTQYYSQTVNYMLQDIDLVKDENKQRQDRNRVEVDKAREKEIKQKQKVEQKKLQIQIKQLRLQLENSLRQSINLKLVVEHLQQKINCQLAHLNEAITHHIDQPNHNHNNSPQIQSVQQFQRANPCI